MKAKTSTLILETTRLFVASGLITAAAVGAGGEVRGECSGSWKVEGNLVKISNREQTGNFDARPLENLEVRFHGIVQTLVQTNDQEQYDKRQNDQTCFHKNEPNMRRYPQAHEWPELLNILVGSNTQLSRDVEPLGVNSIDNRFIFETSTNSILRRKILDRYKLQTVSTTHPLLATLVHSIPDARLRWGWKLEQCTLLATPSNGTAQLDSNPLFVVVDHPKSNETVVFIQWK